MKNLLLMFVFMMLTACEPSTEQEFVLIIQDHRFEPAEVVVPAGMKIKLKIENKDETPEEFHSDDLKREKIILGKQTGFVFIGPLTPGRYKFMGEFHESTAQGAIVVE